MPRQNRLEVTPPPAHAHWGQTKAQITAQDTMGEGLQSMDTSCIVWGHNSHPKQAITHHHTKISLCMLTHQLSGLSMSSKPFTHRTLYKCIYVHTYTHAHSSLTLGKPSFITWHVVNPGCTASVWGTLIANRERVTVRFYFIFSQNSCHSNFMY